MSWTWRKLGGLWWHRLDPFDAGCMSCIVLIGARAYVVQLNSQACEKDTTRGLAKESFSGGAVMAIESVRYFSADSEQQ